MFNWKEFAACSRQSASAFCAADKHLAATLAAPEPLARRTDKVGKPLPESVSINEHPDVPNFRRALSIRRELARGNDPYIAYAETAIRFLDTLGPNDPLYVVLVATTSGVYEFLYESTNQRASVSEVSRLENGK